MIQSSDYSDVVSWRPPTDELPTEYAERIGDLFDTWESVRARNHVLSNYYRMRNRMKDLGISIPPQLVNVNSVVGWADKAVRVMAVRSQFDGFVTRGGTSRELDAACNRNDLTLLYDGACRASLVHGVSAMTVMRDAESPDDAPYAKIRVFSANQCAMTWDKDAGRIGGGIVLSDVDRQGRPSKYVAHFPDAVITISRGDDSAIWTSTVEENPHGVPLMVPFVYDPDPDRPLGHSRITPEVMGIIDKAMRDVLRMEVGAEFFTAPQRYILGAPDDLFDSAQQSDESEDSSDDSTEDSTDDASTTASQRRENMLRAYIGGYLAITRDEDGEVPQVGQFSAGDAQNFISVFENDAQRFSGATNVPIGQLGVLSSTYTSSDALDAANDPLILEVEAMNRRNARSLENVARLSVAIARDTPLGEMDEDSLDVTAHFVDPSMPTFASRADGWTKIAASDSSLVGTRIWYEQLGLPRETIDRIMSAKTDSASAAAYSQIFSQPMQQQTGQEQEQPQTEAVGE